MSQWLTDEERRGIDAYIRRRERRRDLRLEREDVAERLRDSEARDEADRAQLDLHRGVRG